VLCELNVIEQVPNVCRSTVVQEAWERGQQLSVRGWVYALTDGLIRDLQMSVAKPGDASEAFQGALAALQTRAFG
jgi:carbonic anhydrase